MTAKKQRQPDRPTQPAIETVHSSDVSTGLVNSTSWCIVKVQVLSADARTKRIALSIKALLTPSQPHGRNKSSQSMVTDLAERWKLR